MFTGSALFETITFVALSQVKQACSGISSVVGIGLYLSFLLMPRTEKQYGLARFMLLVVSESSAIESGSRVAEVHRIENCSHRLQPF